MSSPWTCPIGPFVAWTCSRRRTSTSPAGTRPYTTAVSDPHPCPCPYRPCQGRGRAWRASALLPAAPCSTRSGHPHTGILVPAQQLVNLVLERIELRRPRRTPRPRRLARAQRHPNRVARQPRPAHQLPDPHATNEVLPAQLSPTLHLKHILLRALDPDDRPRLTTAPYASDAIQGIKSQPANTGQVSTCADSMQ